MAKKEQNIIPRNAKRNIVEQLLQMSAGQPGHIWEVFKENDSWHGVDLTAGDGQRYWMFPAHLRVKELYRFIEVSTECK